MELISVHVPKTAGSTFGNFLTELYGTDRVFKDYDDYAMNPLSPINRDRPAWRVSADQQIRSLGQEFVVVHGHFAIEKYQGVFPEARRIAWVRHPVAWVISLFHFWKNKPLVHTSTTNPLIRRLQHENLPFAEFIEDPTVRNSVSRIFLGGLPPDEYDFLGVQEHFNDDLVELIEMMGWPALQPGFENKNPAPDYDARLREIHDDPRIFDRLLALNEADLTLYETALKLRSQRIKSRQEQADRLDARCSILGGMNRDPNDRSSRVA